MDRVTATQVRRVNVVVYANYGEPNARIIHGRDYDFPDLRTRTCRKLVLRAQEILAGRQVSEFAARRLDLTRNSLTTTWRPIQSRFK